MARNSKVSLVLVGIVFLFTILAGVANAKGAAPWMFETKEECWAAVNAGEGAYRIYVPKDLRGSKKDPVDGVTSIAAPLETFSGVACAEMETQRGRKFVPQAEETEFRFRIKADKSLEDVPYARHDCGNKVYSISYPTPKKPEAEKKAEAKAEAPPAPQTPVYRVGDPCIAVTPDGKQAQGAITQVFANGGASCDAVVEVAVPSKGKAIAQYIICTTAGAVVGGSRSGVVGALSGAAAGAGGTYAGRVIGGENWGWAGCVSGPAVGLIKWGKGGSSRGGSPVSPPLSGGPVSPPLY